MEDEKLVEWALARRLYSQLCEYKGWTPNPAPYVDKGSKSIAATALDFLGYDDDLVTRLREDIDPISWISDEYQKG